jgi:spore maturation protein CgeB
MITLPSQALPTTRFAVRGNALGELGRVKWLPYASFNVLREYISRSTINLVITRQPHAALYGSSTMRPFELAMMGACMVCNPCQGIEEWFEPGTELIEVRSTEEAVDRYQYLLAHDEERQAIGTAARVRALAEHTYQHRARQLAEIIRGYL